MPTEGIDVSNHNKGSFPTIGFEFMFVKASQGVTYRDPFFVGYVADGVRLGVHWGPYHFAEPDAHTPEEEAKWFLRHATPGPLGWALDIETRSVKHDNGEVETFNPLAIMGAAELAKWSERFRELVEPTMGPSWFYSNRDYAKSLYPRLRSDWRMWLATLEGHALAPTFAQRTIHVEQFGVVNTFDSKGVVVNTFDRNLAHAPLITDTGDDDMVPPVIFQLGDANGDLVVIPAGGGRPWTANASDASLIGVLVFRALNPDPRGRYPFPERIPIVTDPAQIAKLRTWLASPDHP